MCEPNWHKKKFLASVCFIQLNPNSLRIKLTVFNPIKTAAKVYHKNLWEKMPPGRKLRKLCVGGSRAVSKCATPLVWVEEKCPKGQHISALLLLQDGGNSWTFRFAGCQPFVYWIWICWLTCSFQVRNSTQCRSWRKVSEMSTHIRPTLLLILYFVNLDGVLEWCWNDTILRKMLKMVGTVGRLDLLIAKHFCIECLPLKARLSRDGLCWGVEVIDIKISLAAVKFM